MNGTAGRKTSYLLSGLPDVGRRSSASGPSVVLRVLTACDAQSRKHYPTTLFNADEGSGVDQVRLQLFALAYNLGNFLRRLVLPKPVKKWSLRTLRKKLIKIGAKVIWHSRYVIFQTEEVAVPMAMFREILNRIRQLRFLTIPARPG